MTVNQHNYLVNCC